MEVKMEVTLETKLLTKKMVAKIIMKSVSWINTQITESESRKKIPKYGFPMPEAKIGKQVFWTEETIERWFKLQVKPHRFEDGK